jgi:hypothetical protein
MLKDRHTLHRILFGNLIHLTQHGNEEGIVYIQTFIGYFLHTMRIIELLMIINNPTQFIG